MARGTIAKTNVINKLKVAFGEDFIGEVDKKIYVWADDGGERVQIAMAMTCPKTFVESAIPVATPTVSSSGWNFDEMVTPVEIKKATITEEETNRIQEMMARLGL